MIQWESSIVDAFHNAPLVVQPPDFLESNFEREVEMVADFCERLSSRPARERDSSMVRSLLSGLTDKKVGVYSCFHDISVYAHGYADPKTTRLAFMCVPAMYLTCGSG